MEESGGKEKKDLQSWQDTKEATHQMNKQLFPKYNKQRHTTKVSQQRKERNNNNKGKEEKKI